MSGDRPVVCTTCSITFSSHPDFLNHLAAIERHDDALLEALTDVVNQACRCEDGTLDSMALSAYRDGMHVLAQHGRLEVTAEHGRRVLGRWTS